MKLEDGSVLEETVEYPIGHKRRRKEGIPLLIDKFKRNLASRFASDQQQRILDASMDRSVLENMPVNDYVDLYIP
jgi:2-methylcitrate dehydratase